MYADFEENFGLLSHAMEIYERAVNLMKQGPEQVECINVYIAKATSFFGIARTRQVFERALEILEPNQTLVQFGLRFAKLERKLNEIDRARAIYLHLSQFCNPAQYEGSFWRIWE
jgi:pre-mRNA-splicing factor SYF1